MIQNEIIKSMKLIFASKYILFMAKIRGISYSLFAEHEIPKQKNICFHRCSHVVICHTCPQGIRWEDIKFFYNDLQIVKMALITYIYLLWKYILFMATNTGISHIIIYYEWWLVLLSYSLMYPHIFSLVELSICCFICLKVDILRF